jgi:hypothetical protein
MAFARGSSENRFYGDQLEPAKPKKKRIMKMTPCAGKTAPGDQ